MKTSLFKAALLGTSLALPAHAATIAYYVDGTDADAAAFTNLAAADPDFTVTDLSQVGLTNSTETSINGNLTPAGPTAGSAAGSEWLFASSGSMGNTANPDDDPFVSGAVSSDDYYSFTVTGNGGVTVDPSSLKFDLVLMRSSVSTQFINYSVFASANGGAFTSVGDGFKDFDTVDVSSVSTIDLDLSSLADSSSYEFRIALADQTSQNNRHALIQGIQFDVVPEPSIALLGSLSLLTLLRRRR